MPFDDSAFSVMTGALAPLITNYRLHSADPGTGEANAIGSGRGTLSISASVRNFALASQVAATGLPASGTVAYLTLWSASSGGTRYGKYLINTGTSTANAAGEFTITAIDISGTASGN